MRRDELSLPDPTPNDRPGDRWVCGAAGGNSGCSRGPSAIGRCPLAESCHPKRTWNGYRKQIAGISVLVLLGCIFFMSRGEMAAKVFKPGDLTTPHAQILGGTMVSDRCASCHPQASVSPVAWFTSGSNGHVDVSQSDRCLDCHHTVMDRSTARLAHNLPQSVRANLVLASSKGIQERSWHDRLPGPSVDQENVECNACHREHRGADADLLAISDAQCQTCHADRFGSFASSHPDWQRWPYGRGRQIAFNHSTHANKHFPGTKRGNETAQFQCIDCHRRREDNELTRSTTFERACQSCHQDSLRLEASEGIELLALPSIPAESAEQIQPWPENATGFYDGKVSPIAELLLRSDSSLASAMREIPDHDFSRIDEASTAAGQTIATAHRELLLQIADEGQSVIVNRASAIGLSPSTMSAFVRSLSPQLLRSAESRWFNRGDVALTTRSRLTEAQTVQHRLAAQPSDDLLGGSDDLLLSPSDDGSDALLLDDSGAGEDLLGGSDALLGGDDLLGGGDALLGDGDALDADPLAENTNSKRKSSSRFDPESMLPAGGWYRDDLRMAIRYKGGGHADPVLKSTIEMISQLPPSDLARKDLLKNRAVAACVSCHPGAVASTRSWHSEPLIGRRSEFTKFTHGPHLNVAQLADCTQCHQISKEPTDPNPIQLETVASGFRPPQPGSFSLSPVGFSDRSAAESSSNPHDPGDFEHLSRGTCAACHTPHAAGDSCITCHRYHIDLR
ncbi:MAG: hypothetical protein AB8B91_15130 [Rubripirellula sp.]